MNGTCRQAAGLGRRSRPSVSHTIEPRSMDCVDGVSKCQLYLANGSVINRPSAGLSWNEIAGSDCMELGRSDAGVLSRCPLNGLWPSRSQQNRGYDVRYRLINPLPLIVPARNFTVPSYNAMHTMTKTNCCPCPARDDPSRPSQTRQKTGQLTTSRDSSRLNLCSLLVDSGGLQRLALAGLGMARWRHGGAGQSDFGTLSLPVLPEQVFPRVPSRAVSNGMAPAPPHTNGHPGRPLRQTRRAKTHNCIAAPSTH